MSPLVGPFPPNSGLVAQAWLGQRVTGLDEAHVAGTLPDVASWADVGFVTVSVIPGTQPSVDIPVRKPVVQVDAWGASANSAKPHWPKAWRLVELIRLATEAPQAYGRTVTLPDEYTDARVQSVYLLSEPNEVKGDPSGYAHVTFDLAIDWVAA